MFFIVTSKFLITLILLTISAISHTVGGTIITDGFTPSIALHIPPSSDQTGATGACLASGTCRLFDVYLPPDYNPNKSYPTVYHLGGLCSTYSTYAPLNKAAMDSMIQAGEIAPLIIIMPDGFSDYYDGNWYVNSAIQGQFEDYIVRELIPYVDNKYNQKRDSSGNAQPFRAIMGQSMGGYGSLYYGVKHPELFCAFAGDSPTSFWLIYTDLASPDGNPMYTFNKLALPELDCYVPEASEGQLLNTNNGYNTLSIFTWSGAFSPNTTRCYPYNVNLPMTGAFVPPAGYNPLTGCNNFNDEAGGFSPVLANQPGTTYLNGYCGGASCDGSSTLSLTGGTYNGKTLVPNPTALQRWPLFDPYALIDTANKEKLKRQCIYLDGGNYEYINSVGARYFSDKLISLDINNEYVLYGIGYTAPADNPCTGCPTTDTGGTHAFCTDDNDSPCQYRPTSGGCYSGSTCYRFTTNLKLFSGKFAEAGNYAPDIQARITGTGTIEFFDTASLIVENIVGIETEKTAGAHSSIKLALYDNSQATIGGKKPGALQVGNLFGKAQLVNTPGLMDNKIDFSLLLNGKNAAFIIDTKGFFGCAVGVNGNQTDFSNYWALSTLANTNSINFDFKRGTFVHDQIASALTTQSSLVAFGNALSVPRSPVQPNTTYSLQLDPLHARIKGGGNMAKILDSNYIHPTVLTTAGTIEPNGIRHSNLINPGNPTDDYVGNPVPYYKNIGSQTFYRNLLEAQILASSDILALNKPTILNSKKLLVNQFFSGLSLTDYSKQKVKSAPTALHNGIQMVDFITPVSSVATITRTSIAKLALASQAALGIKLNPSTQDILVTYDLNP